MLHLVPDGTVVLVGDDTVDGHPGEKVYGKARHRDPVRSTRSHTAWRYGHKWVVLAVLVRFPFAVRPWALPVLVDLYRSEEDDRRRKRPHRTPAQLMCRLLRVMLIRFPGRRLLFVGDAGYGTHEVARFCHRHRDRLALVSKLHPEANLFEPPPPYKGNGRPPVKGPRRPKPREAVSTARRHKRLSVAWYGGGTRRVGAVTGDGHWYKAGRGLVPIRWVFVRDRDGTHRDEYFFTTDPALGAAAIIAHYTSRWSIEIDLRSLKQAMKIDVLRCKSPGLVRKEFWAHLLAANLIRGMMAEAALRHGLLSRQLSFQGARQMIEGFRVELNRASPGKVAGLVGVMLGAAASLRVGDRPDRVEPRVVKRRPKAYPRMQEPRKVFKERVARAG